MPESVNERLASEAVRHAVGLDRYSTGVVRRLIAILNRADADLAAQLYVAIERIPSGSPLTAERLDALLYSVRALNRDAYMAVGAELRNELRELVSYEVGYQQKLFEDALPPQLTVNAVSVEQVYTAALSRPFSVSKNGAVPLNEYLKGLEADRAEKIRDAVRLGYIESEPVEKTIRRIRGTKTQNYADGLMEDSRRKVEGMVRTAINHMSNTTQQNFLEANSDLVTGWKFLATLDSRTSITCASLSGRIFPIGKGPIPPRHIHCRSFATPVTKSWRELGIDIDEISPSTRSSLDGQIPADMSFSAWLRKKPAGFQDEVLGATRGKLFRANQVDVDRFTSNKGVVYSLDDLRKRDAELFRKAGL